VEDPVPISPPQIDLEELAARRAETGAASQAAAGGVAVATAERPEETQALPEPPERSAPVMASRRRSHRKPLLIVAGAVVLAAVAVLGWPYLTSRGGGPGPGNQVGPVENEQSVPPASGPADQAVVASGTVTLPAAAAADDVAAGDLATGDGGQGIDESQPGPEATPPAAGVSTVADLSDPSSQEAGSAAEPADQPQVTTSPAANPPADTVPTGSSPGSAAAATSPEGFGVHVASFRQLSLAESMIRRLNANGFTAFFQRKSVDGEIWHRVYLGPFSQRSRAQQASREVQEKGLASYFFITRLGQG